MSEHRPKDVKRPNPTYSNRHRLGFRLTRQADQSLQSQDGTRYERDARGCLRRVKEQS